MTTAGERLRQLAGFSGTAAALLLAIGQGATAGAALVDYSGLPSATAADHLLAERGKPGAPGLAGSPIIIPDDARARRDEFFILQSKWR